MKQEDFEFSYEELPNNLYRITAQHKDSDLICKLRTNNKMLVKDAFFDQIYTEYYDNKEDARQAIIIKMFDL